MIRLVLFDIDGTLIRTGGVGVKAFGRAMATEFNVSDSTGRVKFSGRTDTSLVRELFQHNQIEFSPVNFRRFFDCYVFWLDYLLRQAQGHVCPGVWAFIREARSLPRPPVIGLLTGNFRLGAEIKLRRYELWELFQTGAFSDDHEDRNQIAAVAHGRGNRLLDEPLRGDQILVVGDTPHDIRCARHIGARTLAVATGGAGIEELKPHEPDWLVGDLSDVNARDICLQ